MAEAADLLSDEAVDDFSFDDAPSYPQVSFSEKMKAGLVNLGLSGLKDKAEPLIKNVGVPAIKNRYAPLVILILGACCILTTLLAFVLIAFGIKQVYDYTNHSATFPKMELQDRFIAYTKFSTQSDDDSTTSPTTKGQCVLASHLHGQLTAMGLKGVELTADCLVYATLPAHPDYAGSCPGVGFIAHMDTAPDAPGDGVVPIVTKYAGGDITLPLPKDAPSVIPAAALTKYVGNTIISSSGNTLLGADDKAGIAIIMDALQALLTTNKDIVHPPLQVAFTTDEEVGRGADHFSVARFGAVAAYTIDGGTIGEVEAENFNAVGAEATFSGVSIHPGSAYEKMVNSMHAAAAFVDALPWDHSPRESRGREGFVHAVDVAGNVASSRVKLIVRSFEDVEMQTYLDGLHTTLAQIAAEYPLVGCTITNHTQYRNMKPEIDAHPEVLQRLMDAATAAGVTPTEVPIRGGTDGARLSFMGLPTPNVWTGAELMHSVTEFVPVESMEAAVKTVLELARVWGQA